MLYGTQNVGIVVVVYSPVDADADVAGVVAPVFVVAAAHYVIVAASIVIADVAVDATLKLNVDAVADGVVNAVVVAIVN